MKRCYILLDLELVFHFLQIRFNFHAKFQLKLAYFLGAEIQMSLQETEILTKNMLIRFSFPEIINCMWPAPRTRKIMDWVRFDFSVLVP